MIWLILIIALIIYILIQRNAKSIKTNCVCLVTGAPKTGKSTVALLFARRKYKKQLFKYYIKKYLLFKDIEKPLFYSNIPVCWSYVEITKELLTRKKRFAYGSVVYIGEMSLVADSQLFKDPILNEELMLFIKLFGHETLGGYLYLDTQSVEDNHFSIKRCLDSYIYIHHMVKWIPFIVICKVRELKYSSDNQTAVNVFNTDIEDDMKTLVVRKKIWRYFDYCCYSVLTDNLEVENNVLPKDMQRDLKARKIVSFKDFKTINLKGGVLCEKEN